MSRPDGVQGRTVLVTGASSGIGAATARLLASRGAYLLLTGRDAAALGALGVGTCRAADLGDRAELEGLAGWAVDAGPPDVVILAAGIGAAGALEEMSAGDVERLVDVDLVAPLQLTRLFLPSLRARGRGHVVLVSSVAGTIGVRNEAVYAAAKAGLRGFAQSLRWELDGSGVRVSTVVPGLVDTAFFVRRGVPHGRSFPRPLPAERVASAIAGVLDRPRDEVFAPSWLRLPARLNGVAPSLTGALARRFG